MGLDHGHGSRIPDGNRVSSLLKYKEYTRWQKIMPYLNQPNTIEHSRSTSTYHITISPLAQGSSLKFCESIPSTRL